MFKTRFTYLALALGLATAGACDNDDKTRDNAENAAEDLKDKTADLKDEANDVVEVRKDQAEDVRDEDLQDRVDIAKDTAEDVRDESKDMMKQGIATRDAMKEFEYQRMVRVQTLRAVHGIAASQPMLINAFAGAQALRDTDRAKINEKVSLVQMRLDESANLIQSLEGVDAEHWKDREKDVAAAMERLEDAREDAWEALDEADRLDKTSMR